MLSMNHFYIGDDGAYVISKITDKTVTFSPVKSFYVEHIADGSAYLYDTRHKATTEPDEQRKPIRFKLSNQFSTKDLASFYESKKGCMESMSEIEGDTFIITHNYG